MAVRTGLRFNKIQAWVSPALLQWVDTFAQQNGISRAALVRRALVSYLTAAPEPDTKGGQHKWPRSSTSSR